VFLGGLLLSTFVTLFLTPAMFSLTMDAKSQFLKLLNRAGRASAAGSGAADRRPDRTGSRKQPVSP
jgi:hypothetical protein